MNSGHGIPNAAGWSRLPHDPSLVRIEIINYLLVGEEHPPAAVPLHAEVIEDPPLREKLVVAAKEKVKKFSWPTITKEVLSLYDSL